MFQTKSWFFTDAVQKVHVVFNEWYTVVKIQKRLNTSVFSSIPLMLEPNCVLVMTVLKFKLHWRFLTALRYHVYLSSAFPRWIPYFVDVFTVTFSEGSQTFDMKLLFNVHFWVFYVHLWACHVYLCVPYSFILLQCFKQKVVLQMLCIGFM